MSKKPNFKSLVYAQNAAKDRTAKSNKTMMTTIIIVNDSHLIQITEMAPTHETHWKNIQSFDRLSDNTSWSTWIVFSG